MSYTKYIFSLSFSQYVCKTHNFACKVLSTTSLLIKLHLDSIFYQYSVTVDNRSQV